MFGRPAPTRIVRRLVAALAGLVAVVVGAVLLAVVVVPRVAGWVPLTVLSGSMAPAIPTGSQVIVRPVADAVARTVAAMHVVLVPVGAVRIVSTNAHHHPHD